ncbi:hypothetical protein LTS17_011356 [Exophiala oligosperma]
MDSGRDQPELVDLVSDSESDEEVFDHLKSPGHEPLHRNIITTSHADPMGTMQRLFPPVLDAENNTQQSGDGSLRPLLHDDHEASEHNSRSPLSGNGGSVIRTGAPRSTGAADSHTQNPVILDILDDDNSSSISDTAMGSDDGRNGLRVLPGLKPNPKSRRQPQGSRKEDEKDTKLTTTVDLSQLSDEDDDDWRRAVELSLQDSAAHDNANVSPSGNDSNPESEDESLKKAIALSLLDADAVSDDNGSTSGSPAKCNNQDGMRTTKPEVKLDKSNDTELYGINAAAQHSDGDTRKERCTTETTLSDSLATPTAKSDPIVGSTATNLDGDSSKDKSAFSILTLNRKQMEEERLARLKRKRESDLEAANDKDSKQIRLDHTASSARSISPPAHQRQAHRTGTQYSTGLSSATANTRLGKSSTSDSSHSHSSAPSPTSPPFSTGKVFKTALADASTVSSIDTISFAQLISPSKCLESALLSSFIWDFDWLFPHFDTKRTKFQLVMHGKSAAQRASIRAEFAGVNNVRIAFPPMDGITNCMHSKLMLLFYTDEPASKEAAPQMTPCSGRETKQDWSRRCRVVVPTANLVGFDWGVGSFMENTVFVIDLPGNNISTSSTSTGRKTETERTTGIADAKGKTQFEASLRAFLEAQTVPDDVLAKLSSFDFSLTSDLAFVHTLGGAHTKPQIVQSTGLPGLANAVTQLGLATRRELQLDYVTSSLGNLNETFMRNVYNAAQGDTSVGGGLATAPPLSFSSSSSSTFFRRAEPIKTKTAAGLLHDAGVDDGEEGHGGESEGERDAWRKNFRVYYPSDTTVRSSKGGMHNAGTICFSSKWWAQPSFPRSNLRDCVSLREGLLMHNKILFVRPTSTGSEAQHRPSNEHAQPQRPWMYVGSANLSESAWGKLVQDRSSKQPKLNCRNWECGVIIPLPLTNEGTETNGIAGPGETETHSSSESLADFEKIVTVPMRYPGESFVAKGQKKPWTLFD